MFDAICKSACIAATDCLDPLTLSVEIYLLTTRRPILNSINFLTAILVSTAVFGLLLSFGVLVEVNKMLAHPGGIYYAFQLAVGFLLILAGRHYWYHAAHKKGAHPINVSVTPFGALFLGVSFTATDLPTNLPLIAVAEFLDATGATVVTVIAASIVYSLVRIAPAALLLGLFVIERDKSSVLINKIKQPLIHWGHRMTSIIVIILGIVLSSDSVYFYVVGRSFIKL